MANIERRRKKRKALIISSAVGTALLICLIVALVLVLKKSCAHTKQKGEAASSSAPTGSVSPEPDETLIPVSETPAAIETPVPTPDPSEPSEMPDASPASTGEPAEEPPVRVTEELSTAVLKLDCSTRFDASGSAEELVTGSFAVLFVNNTDRTLYAAEFNVGSFTIGSVDIDGAAAAYSVTDGKLSIPLLNELKQNDTIEIYFEFEAVLKLDSEFILPNIAYDTPFVLTADIMADTWLGFDGCSFRDKEAGSRQSYTLIETSVREVKVRFRY